MEPIKKVEEDHPYWITGRRMDTSCGVCDLVGFPRNFDKIKENTEKLREYAKRGKEFDYPPGLVATVISGHPSRGGDRGADLIVNEMVKEGWLLLCKFKGQYAEYHNNLMGLVIKPRFDLEEKK